MREYSLALRNGGARIGLVPTMGALHGGHLSLLKIAAEHCDHTIMSIFVNPAQFGPAEDFDKYPRQAEKDCALAEAAGCDCVFIPPAGDMYPAGYSTYVDVGSGLAGALCGASRPGHFRGVATVVLKLFNIVAPDTAVFGSKDAQQVVVIKRVVEDLNLSVKVIAAPTVREPDGLAMSSRNAYLSAPERAEAPLICRGLTEAKEMYDGGGRDAGAIRDHIVSILSGARLIKPEYVETVDTKSLEPVDKLEGTVLIAVACRTLETGTRLIDNIVLGGSL